MWTKFKPPENAATNWTTIALEEFKSIIKQNKFC